MSERKESERFEDRDSVTAGKVPIPQKVTLTIKEAAEYSNIGINKIESMLKQPNYPFVLYVDIKTRQT